MKPNWREKSIGEVCNIINGGTPDTSEKEYWGDDVLWITPKDLGKLRNNYVEDTERKISQIGLRNSSAKILPINSIILSTRAPIGHLAINKKEITTNQGCKGLIPKKEILTLFLFYYLKKSINLLNDLGSGTTFKELSSTKLSDVMIPLPPLPEQLRIVEILDQSFAAIDQAIANTERNLNSAFDLFDTYIKKTITNLTAKWDPYELQAISIVKSGGTPSKIKLEYWEGEIPWYSSGELNKIFTQDPKVFITEMGLNNSNAKVFPKGSLLIGMYDTAALKMSILDRSAAFNQAIAGMNPKNNVDLLYVMYAITAFKHEILNQRRGVRQKNLSLEKIKKISIPFPPLEIQELVSKKINKVQKEVLNLVSVYQQKLQLLAELKQSILQKAFDGELT